MNLLLVTFNIGVCLYFCDGGGFYSLVEHCDHFGKDGFIWMVVVKDGVRNLSEDKINRVKNVSEDLDWFMCIVFIANFKGCMNGHQFYSKDVL